MAKPWLSPAEASGLTARVRPRFAPARRSATPLDVCAFRASAPGRGRSPWLPCRRAVHPPSLRPAASRRRDVAHPVARPAETGAMSGGPATDGAPRSCRPCRPDRSTGVAQRRRTPPAVPFRAIPGRLARSTMFRRGAFALHQATRLLDERCARAEPPQPAIFRPC